MLHFENLIKIMILVKNAQIRVEPMKVVAQVDLAFAAHVSFTPFLFIKAFTPLLHSFIDIYFWISPAHLDLLYQYSIRIS